MLHDPNILLRSVGTINSLDAPVFPGNHGVQGVTSPQKMRVKIAVAGVLVIVLVVVILPRKESPSACSLSQDLPRQETQHSNANLQKPLAFEPRPLAGPTPHRALPSIELSAIVSRNPFSGSNRSMAANSLTADRGTSQQAASQDNRQETPVKPTPPPPSLLVSAIITGKGKPAALVDNRLIFVNDIVQEHWRVVGIRPAGLLLEPVQPAYSR